MMIPQNKNVRQLVWHLHIDTAVEGSELYYYNTEDNKKSVLWELNVILVTVLMT